MDKKQLLQISKQLRMIKNKVNTIDIDIIQQLIYHLDGVNFSTSDKIKEYSKQKAIIYNDMLKNSLTEFDNIISIINDIKKNIEG